MIRSTLFCISIACFAHSVDAGNWSNWRGPGRNGVAEGSGYPVVWDAHKNVLWQKELPGRGSSRPIVWGNQIFLTCGIDELNHVLSFDFTGKELWREKVGHEKPGKHKKASGSNSSCVTDGTSVFAYFKSGDLAALSLQGKPQWSINLQEKFGEDTLWWDLGTSPVLTAKNCIVAVMQTGGSYLVAIDKKTGEVVWRVDRNLDAPEEAAQSYSTPLVINDGERELLIVLGADHVTAHRADTGEELWRIGGLNPTQHKYFRSIASPVAAEGMIVAPYARGGTVTAIRLGGRGDVTNSHIAWTKKGDGPDVPTPAVADGKAYILNDKGIVTCVDVKTGEKIWSGQTEKNRHTFSSSPILADGKIYITREDGTTFVLAQGDEFKVLAMNELDGNQTVATPVFVNQRILIRTDSHLYCIGNEN